MPRPSPFYLDAAREAGEARQGRSIRAMVLPGRLGQRGKFHSVRRSPRSGSRTRLRCDRRLGRLEEREHKDNLTVIDDDTTPRRPVFAVSLGKQIEMAIRDKPGKSSVPV